MTTFIRLIRHLFLCKGKGR